jgi:RNA recognition motif-containing protein
MSSKLFVGGLAWATRDETLHEHFSQCGEVTDAKVIMERETGRSRGFGFVTFADSETAAKARDELNNSDLDGRSIRVDTATERPNRGGGGGGGGGYRD